MNALTNQFFWILCIELFLLGMVIIHSDFSTRIVERFILSIRIGFCTALLFMSGGTYHTTITVEKDGEVIEEYDIRN